MRCNKVITPDKKQPRRVTYCQLEPGHEGECSILKEKTDALRGRISNDK